MLLMLNVGLKELFTLLVDGVVALINLKLDTARARDLGADV